MLLGGLAGVSRELAAWAGRPVNRSAACLSLFEYFNLFVLESDNTVNTDLSPLSPVVQLLGAKFLIKESVELYKKELKTQTQFLHR